MALLPVELTHHRNQLELAIKKQILYCDNSCKFRMFSFWYNRRLVEKLDNMKKNAIGNGSTQCILCGDEFGLLGASPTYCDDCKKVIEVERHVLRCRFSFRCMRNPKQPLSSSVSWMDGCSFRFANSCPFGSLDEKPQTSTKV